MFEIFWDDFYTGEKRNEKRHGNTNFEELDNEIYSRWKNFHQGTEFQIFDDGKLVRKYPKVR